jgi:protoporphyrinogen oxidase
MRYPVKGGYKSFLGNLVTGADIRTGLSAVEIDYRNKWVAFSDGSKQYYDHLVSSIPLPDLAGIIKDVPLEVRKAANDLLYTSGLIISFGFNTPDIPKYLWFYIYDEDIVPARAFSPSIKSADNVPEGKSSIQFESYFSVKKPDRLTDIALSEHIIKSSDRMKVFSKSDIEVIDAREIKYANVIFDHKMKKNRKTIHNFLDSAGIKYIGRFGEWDYLWSDQSFLSGMRIRIR